MIIQQRPEMGVSTLKIHMSDSVSPVAEPNCTQCTPGGWGVRAPCPAAPSFT